MSSKQLLKNFPKEFQKIGVLVYQFNFIEIQIIHLLTIFFGNKGGKPEKDAILNNAFSNVEVFENFENKIKLLKMIISTLNRVAKEKGRRFSEVKYMKVCEKIKHLQKVRNQLAHNYLGIRVDGKGVGFRRRKKDKERIDEFLKGIKSDVDKQVLIDLDEELKKSDDMYTGVIELYGLLADAQDLGVL